MSVDLHAHQLWQGNAIFLSRMESAVVDSLAPFLLVKNKWGKAKMMGLETWRLVPQLNTLQLDEPMLCRLLSLVWLFFGRKHIGFGVDTQTA